MADLKMVSFGDVGDHLLGGKAVITGGDGVDQGHVVAQRFFQAGFLDSGKEGERWAAIPKVVKEFEQEAKRLDMIIKNDEVGLLAMEHGVEDNRKGKYGSL